MVYMESINSLYKRAEKPYFFSIKGPRLVRFSGQVFAFDYNLVGRFFYVLLEMGLKNQATYKVPNFLKILVAMDHSAHLSFSRASAFLFARGYFFEEIYSRYGVGSFPLSFYSSAMAAGYAKGALGLHSLFYRREFFKVNVGRIVVNVDSHLSLFFGNRSIFFPKANNFIATFKYTMAQIYLISGDHDFSVYSADPAAQSFIFRNIARRQYRDVFFKNYFKELSVFFFRRLFCLAKSCKKAESTQLSFFFSYFQNSLLKILDYFSYVKLFLGASIFYFVSSADVSLYRSLRFFLVEFFILCASCSPKIFYFMRHGGTAGRFLLRKFVYKVIRAFLLLPQFPLVVEGLANFYALGQIQGYLYSVKPQVKVFSDLAFLKGFGLRLGFKASASYRQAVFKYSFSERKLSGSPQKLKLRRWVNKFRRPRQRRPWFTYIHGYLGKKRRLKWLARYAKRVGNSNDLVYGDSSLRPVWRPSVSKGFIGKKALAMIKKDWLARRKAKRRRLYANNKVKRPLSPRESFRRYNRKKSKDTIKLQGALEKIFLTEDVSFYNVVRRYFSLSKKKTFLHLNPRGLPFVYLRYPLFCGALRRQALHRAAAFTRAKEKLAAHKMQLASLEKVKPFILGSIKRHNLKELLQKNNPRRFEEAWFKGVALRPVSQQVRFSYASTRVVSCNPQMHTHGFRRPFRSFGQLQSLQIAFGRNLPNNFVERFLEKPAHFYEVLKGKAKKMPPRFIDILKKEEESNFIGNSELLTKSRAFYFYPFLRYPCKHFSFGISAQLRPVVEVSPYVRRFNSLVSVRRNFVPLTPHTPVLYDHESIVKNNGPKVVFLTKRFLFFLAFFFGLPKQFLANLTCTRTGFYCLRLVSFLKLRKLLLRRRGFAFSAKASALGQRRSKVFFFFALRELYRRFLRKRRQRKLLRAKSKLNRVVSLKHIFRKPKVPLGLRYSFCFFFQPGFLPWRFFAKAWGKTFVVFKFFLKAVKQWFEGFLQFSTFQWGFTLPFNEFTFAKLLSVHIRSFFFLGRKAFVVKNMVSFFFRVFRIFALQQRFLFLGKLWVFLLDYVKYIFLSLRKKGLHLFLRALRRRFGRWRPRHHRLKGKGRQRVRVPRL